jgi:hypothetical protein
MRVYTQRFGCSLSRVILLGALAISAAAQSKPWTAAGATGTVDESDTAKVRFVLGEAQMQPGMPIGTASVIRYNVVAVDDTIALGVPRLTVRYRTGDSTGRVVVRLYRYNFNPGGAAALITQFDSNAFPATGGAYATRSAMNCAVPAALDFVNNAYFIEVHFVKVGALGNPGLGTLKVDRRICPVVGTAQ